MWPAHVLQSAFWRTPVAFVGVTLAPVICDCGVYTLTGVRVNLMFGAMIAATPHSRTYAIGEGFAIYVLPSN